MSRIWLAWSFLLAGVPCAAQYPYTQVHELRVGQRRTAITRLAMDRHGLIWAASNQGLLRLDGDRVEVMLATGDASITAMAAFNEGMAVALSSGAVLACNGYRSDTLLVDPTLVRFPVRAMVVDDTGTIHLGTYGAGIRSLTGKGGGTVSKIENLPDDHVNDLCVLRNGQLVAATDQGLALCRSGQVVEVFGQRQAAPDNLVLSVATDPERGVWAGTDNGGAFHWLPGGAGVVDAVSKEASGGAVRDIAVQQGAIWTAGALPGARYFGRDRLLNAYTPSSGLLPQALPALDLLCDREGALWWCDGTGKLYRADPAVFLIPSIGGMDLTRITAIDVAQGQLWFATSEGLFSCPIGAYTSAPTRHGAVPVHPKTPIVSLDVAEDGTTWAATFGSGLFALRPNGGVERFDRANSGLDPNVLSVQTRGKETWAATLTGLCCLLEGQATCFKPNGPGFMFMALPLDNGTVLGATDGNGLVQLEGHQLETVGRNGPRTLYSLARDGSGNIWAVGPESGLCRLRNDTLVCTAATLPLFQSNLFALAAVDRHVLVFSDVASMAYEITTGRWSDFTAKAGLEDLQAELNTVATAPDGSLWLACNKGLVCLRAPHTWFSPKLTTVITDVVVDNVHHHAAGPWETPHDRSAVTFRFAAPYYADPGALRFEYRLLGLSDNTVRTREREMSYPALPPGTYTFEVRAFIGEEPGAADWTRQRFTIVPPWWQLWWVAPGAVLLLVAVLVLWFRARERRIRYRQQLEQDQVRFQLDALRSQVDPHFLFNSFNTLVELIETEPAKAVVQVEELSAFFRNILQVRDKATIPLGDELDLVATYFSLEQRRFGEAIAMEVEVGLDDRRMLVVPMTLQLLVENALKHNVATIRQPLRISIRSADGYLIVGNAIRPRSSPVRSTGFGLDSIRRRYAALSPQPVTAQASGGRFEARIPLIHP